MGALKAISFYLFPCFFLFVGEPTSTHSVVEIERRTQRTLDNTSLHRGQQDKKLQNPKQQQALAKQKV